MGTKMGPSQSLVNIAFHFCCHAMGRFHSSPVMFGTGSFPFPRSNNTNARLMAFAPSLALDPTYGIQSHKALDLSLIHI